MAISLSSISKSTAIRAPRTLLLGTPKVGKSTFAAAAPSPIFIPIKGEEGIDAIDVPAFPTVRTFADLLECIGVLYNDAHDYQTVVIDSASTLEPLVWDETCRLTGAKSIEQVNGGYGKGYVEVLTQWREILDGLDALRNTKGMGSILIGHVQVKPFNDPTADSYDNYVFDIHKNAAALIDRWADCILFANRKAAVRKEEVSKDKTKARAVAGERPSLFTDKRPAHPGGGRWPYGPNLPYELPLDWPAFEAAVGQVIATRQK